jgi:5S rRNA maturation endonuclease (ribonuclease M5)
VRENGNGWKAKCPAHDDSTPSLSVTGKTSGEVLLSCFAGCDAEAVLDAAGLSFADLYPDRGDGAATPAQPPRKERSRKPKGIGADDVNGWCNTLLDGEKGAHRRAREYLVEKRGIAPELLRSRRVGLRHDKGIWWIVFPLAVESGRVTLRKERGFDPGALDWKRDDGGKPFMRTKGGGSCLVVMGNDEDARLLLCEGETDAFAARSNGFNAAFGSAGAGTFKREWAERIARLNVESVTVCYDGDDAGRKGAQKAADLLVSEGVHVTVAVLLDEADVNDVLTEEGPERLREIIADATPYDDAPEPPPAPAESETGGWQPFPVEALPGPAADYVRAGAAAVGCAEAMVALPVLSSLSAAAGSAARLRLKRTWRAPATLWTMVVAPSGSAKSPAMKQALRPVHRRERDAKDEFERAFAEWKAREDAPEEDRPGRTRYRTGDATPESIMKLLGENPRGLLLARNELGAWLGPLTAMRREPPIFSSGSKSGTGCRQVETAPAMAM